jgi:hypothetical protein
MTSAHCSSTAPAGRVKWIVTLPGLRLSWVIAGAVGVTTLEDTSGSSAKVAVTFSFGIVALVGYSTAGIEHAPTPLQPPLQPVKVHPTAGVASSVTGGFRPPTKQAPGQLTTVVEPLLTLPWPSIVTETVWLETP